MQDNSPSKALRLGLFLAAGFVVLLVALFSATAVTLPGCGSCHRSPEFVSQTAQHKHADVPCVTCHAAGTIPHRLAYAYDLIVAQTARIQPSAGGPITAVPDSACLKCHADVMKRKVTRGPNILHAKCTKGRRCVDCHAAVAHGTAVKWLRNADMNVCLSCHNADRVRADCGMCHTKRRTEDRLRTGEWQVTHGPNWRKTHGMGDLKTCAACHDQDKCKQCHHIQLPHGPDFIRTHPADARTHRSDCAVCHQQQFCDSCHGLPMPHPESFTPQHSTIVDKQGRQKCLRCHVEDDCTNCHLKHVHPGGALDSQRKVNVR